MIRAVVFDLDEVLAPGHGTVTEPARLLGVPEDRFAELYRAGRPAYEAGASDAAFWTPLLTGLGRPAAVETIQQLARLDADLWLRLRPAARALLAEVRRAGHPVAVLANAPFNVDLGLVDADFAEDADYWFLSASMGVRKPERAAYERVTEVLDLAPYEVAFLDDDPAHVAGAEVAGWAAHRWSSDADARAWLVGLGALPERS